MIAPPVITVASTFTVAEGDSLQLQATVTSPGFPVSAVTWDLNGDGIFGDAVGASVSVPWTQLVALGLTDDNDGRRLPIAVRAVNSQGASDAASTLSITATDPTVNVSAPATVGVGTPYTVPLSSSQFGSDSVTGWLVTWGDGSAAESLGSTAISATHLYALPQTYHVLVQVITEDGTFPSPADIAFNATVTAQNVPPTIDQFVVPAGGLQGTPVALSASASDSGPFDTLTYAWTVTRNGQPFASSALAAFSFTPDIPGTYQVGLSVTDNYGAATLAPSAAVIVADAAPTILLVQADGTVPEGALENITVVASDPGGASDPLLYDFGFIAPGQYEATNSTGTLGHAFPQDGNYPVYIRVRDQFGLAATTSLNVTVAPAAPVAVIAGAGTGSEGQPYTLSLGPVTDPDADAVGSWTINWGDGQTDVVAGNATSAGHNFAEGGAYAISASITNADGTYPASGAVAVNIADAAPTLTIGGGTSVNEGPLHAEPRGCGLR